jgi:hypothetical protein
MDVKNDTVGRNPRLIMLHVGCLLKGEPREKITHGAFPKEEKSQRAKRTASTVLQPMRPRNSSALSGRHGNGRSHVQLRPPKEKNLR